MIGNINTYWPSTRATFATSRHQKVPLAIFDQSQKTAAGSGVGMFRDKLLAKQRVAYLAQIGHQSIEYVLGQSIVEAIHQAANGAERVALVANLHFRFRLGRVPSGIRPDGMTKGFAQMVRYRTGKRASF